MERQQILRMKTFLATLSLGAVVACSQPSQTPGNPSQGKYVVLSMTEFTGGNIAGLVSCEDDKGQIIISDQCVASAPYLAEVVALCGPLVVTIDRSMLHGEAVSFPIDLRPEAPSSLEVVRCVQRKVGFSFSAAIAPARKDGEPPSIYDGNENPFASLHSPMKRRSP